MQSMATKWSERKEADDNIPKDPSEDGVDVSGGEARKIAVFHKGGVIQ